MARPTALHLSLIFAIFFCAQGIASADFDFYFLVLQWPGSYCRGSAACGCCKPDTPYNIDADFLIKGLYTYNYDGQAVTKCKDTRFLVNALSSLIGDLYVHWPSIACPSNNGLSLWKAAWSNYGVCSGLSEKEYFQTALNLRNKTDILSVLKSKSLAPSDVVPVYPSVVKAAIKLGLGTDVGIKCSRNSKGESLIDEIYVCVDKKASKVIDCPVFPKSDCTFPAYFPTFSLDMLKVEDDVIEMVVGSQAQ